VETANYNTLKSLADRLGADLFGVASTDKLMRYIDNELKPSAAKLPYTISIAVRLQRAVLESLINRPNDIYKTHYRQVNATLDNITQEVARHIQQAGHQAIPIAASFILDWKRQNAHISHRHAALEAGLGFWGKNNLLIHPEYGAGIRLASILTDMPLKLDSPIANDCDGCLACMAACPAEAISENGFDFEKCYEQIKRFCNENNYNLMVCGLCLKACTDARS
jgi:epoxyqueuosine reductase